MVAGYGEWARNNYVTAAVSDDRRLLVAYLPELQSVSVDFSFLSGDAFAVAFFDPRTGERSRLKPRGRRRFAACPSPPGEDLVLMIQAR